MACRAVLILMQLYYVTNPIATLGPDLRVGAKILMTDGRKLSQSNPRVAYNDNGLTYQGSGFIMGIVISSKPDSGQKWLWMHRAANN